MSSRDSMMTRCGRQKEKENAGQARGYGNLNAQAAATQSKDLNLARAANELAIEEKNIAVAENPGERVRFLWEGQRGMHRSCTC